MTSRLARTVAGGTFVVSLLPSTASSVEIRLVERDGDLELAIRDDGVGFDPSAGTVVRGRVPISGDGSSS